MNYREDSYYIKKVLGGNLPSYAILVEKHKNLAFTLALRVAKNHEDAEEIAQDAFLKAYNSLNSFKQESKFSTWLYKIVFNAAISKMRKKRMLHVSIDAGNIGNTMQEERISSLEALHKKERKKIIAEAIARLKEEESVVMTLYYFNENTLKEIEDITGFSNSNIKILLHRGRKKLLLELKKILKEEIVDIL
jgi:RNA polymerase sigma factor (sigma-70 family)